MILLKLSIGQWLFSYIKHHSFLVEKYSLIWIVNLLVLPSMYPSVRDDTEETWISQLLFKIDNFFWRFSSPVSIHKINLLGPLVCQVSYFTKDIYVIYCTSSVFVLIICVGFLYFWTNRSYFVMKGKKRII